MRNVVELGHRGSVVADRFLDFIAELPQRIKDESRIVSNAFRFALTTSPNLGINWSNRSPSFLASTSGMLLKYELGLGQECGRLIFSCDSYHLGLHSVEPHQYHGRQDRKPIINPIFANICGALFSRKNNH